MSSFFPIGFILAIAALKKNFVSPALQKKQTIQYTIILLNNSAFLR